MKQLLHSLIIYISLLSSVFSGTIDPNIDDSKYIQYGQQHKCVVEIVGTVENTALKYRASAVIIKPRIILTAAHVIKSGKDPFIVVNEEKINILFSIILADYKEDKLEPFDIAIAYLEKPVQLDFYPELYSKDDEVGKTCSLAGYGMTGTFRTGMVKHDGQKRAGSNKIDTIINNMLVCSVNKPPKTSLEFLICSGDSGGGLFIDQKLAGIHSCIMTDDGKLDANYNEESLHTRISLHKEWIDEMVLKLEKLGIDK